MELSGESQIAATRARVWQALNDPVVLARCIDGVESLTRVGDGDRFEGRMNAKVGPVRATFTGGVTLTEVDAPNRYVLVGEGKGGVAGFAKGTAEVVLHDENGGTRLAYTVQSSVGGRLAQLGARLIEGTARGYAESFFAKFKREVETAESDGAVPAAGDADTGVLPAETDGRRSVAGLSPMVWGGVLIVVLLALLAWQLS